MFIDVRLASKRTLPVRMIVATAVKCLAALVIAGNVAILSSVYKRDSMMAQPIDDWAVAVSALAGSGNCTAVAGVTDAVFLASGWTKAVYKAKMNGRDVAVKTVNVNGHDYGACRRSTATDPATDPCYRRVGAKILKEIALLKAFNHPNVLQVLEYCVPEWDGEERPSSVAVVTELGQPLDIIWLLQLSWEDRLRIVFGLTRLVSALASSNLVMNDFRRQQFVMVNGELKLTDADDATVPIEDPPCSASWQCTVDGPNGTIRGPCRDGRCVGHGERMNIYNAGRHFATFLLPHRAPWQLRPLVDDIVNAFANVSWDAARLMDRMDEVVNLFVSGKYLGRRSDLPQGKYRRLSSSDLPGMYDYRCQLSLSGNGCTLSMFDVQEAEHVCDVDPDCRAFVVTADHTWTGRTIVHFKNNFSESVVHSPLTTLYLKEV